MLATLRLVALPRSMHSNYKVTRVPHHFPVRLRRRLAIILIGLAGIEASSATVCGGFAERPLTTILLAAFSAGLAGASATAAALLARRWRPCVPILRTNASRSTSNST